MRLRCIACRATRLYLRDLEGKPVAERAGRIISEGEKEGEDATTKVIRSGIDVIDQILERRSEAGLERIRDNAASAAMWARHQVLADLGISGLVDFVVHADTCGYYTPGMATDILPWWDRAGDFFLPATGEYLDTVPSESELQTTMDSLSKRVCSCMRVVVKLGISSDLGASYTESMNSLLAVFREAASSGKAATVY